jgi:hypothetical protein
VREKKRHENFRGVIFYIPNADKQDIPEEADHWEQCEQMICWVKRIFDSLSSVVPTGEGTPGWLFRTLGKAKSKAVEMATKGSSVFLPLNQTDIAAMKMLRLRNHITVAIPGQFWLDGLSIIWSTHGWRW